MESKRPILLLCLFLGPIDIFMRVFISRLYASDKQVEYKRKSNDRQIAKMLNREYVGCIPFLYIFGAMVYFLQATTTR